MVNFTPGPSQLFFTVSDHLKTALREGIPSLSHRSKEFEAIYRHCTDGLRQLLSIPDNFHIFFTSSATEIWERIGQNLVAEKSWHLVNGAFSARFEEIVRELGKSTITHHLPPGKAAASLPTIPREADLLAVTHNETSTGVSLPSDFLAALRVQNPEAILAIDAVSSLPFADLDYQAADTVFFSVQKGFGLPAGLGVWLVNDRCLAKAAELRKSGVRTGTYHSLEQLHSFSQKFQTPETPNVLGIYLLGRVVEDFNRRTAKVIRQETRYKSALLYQVLERHSLVKPFVTDVAWRSDTVVVAHVETELPRLVSWLRSHHLAPGDGYGAAKSHQLRFANFPAHSREQFELLADKIEAWH